ncbi:MAG: SDR family NAD(P)-dependent oxidoreductase, partial [Bacteroidaceae bacterium]|nr:SDR family NAD(P)-dependent oxidoreductase [Bacteroidaceae bacterium]
MKYIVIIGATSGIGLEVAKIYIQQGWKVGIAGRRISELEALQCVAPAQVELQVLDVMQEDAAEKMNQLINRLGGMDLFFLSSGIGKQNPSLQSEIEILTARTNVEGFIRMTTAAYRYFASEKRVGHIAVISSV